MFINRKFPYRYRVLIFLFFLIFITYLDRICISLLGVRIKSEFKLSNEQFGWVLASFSLAYAIFEIPSGIFGDRLGQRAVLIRIVLWWSIFTALTGFTTGLVSLIAVRFLFGMGESGAFPNSSGVISHWFPVKETATSMSSLFVGQSAGSAFAPLIVIPLAASFGWRAPFYINSIIGILWVLICIFWFRNNPSEIKGVSNEEKDLIEKNRRFIEHKQSFPWKIVFKNRSLLALVTAFFCSQWGNYFLIAWMPVYLQEGRHFSEDDMKMFTSYFFFVATAGSLVAGFFSDWLVAKKGLRFGRRFPQILGLGMVAIAFYIAAIIKSNPIVVISLFVGGFVFASFNGTVSFSTCIDIGSSRAGTVAGIMNFFGQTGAFVLAITFGKIADVTHNFKTPMLVLATVLLIGSFLWIFVDPSKSLVVTNSSET